MVQGGAEATRGRGLRLGCGFVFGRSLVPWPPCEIAGTAAAHAYAAVASCSQEPLDAVHAPPPSQLRRVPMCRLIPRRRQQRNLSRTKCGGGGGGGADARPLVRGRRDATDGGRDGEDGSAPVLLAVRGGDVDTRGRDADTRTGCLCGTCFAACDIWGYPMRGTSTCGDSIWLSGATPFGATQLGANQNGAALHAVPYTPCPTRCALHAVPYTPCPTRRALHAVRCAASARPADAYSSPVGRPHLVSPGPTPARRAGVGGTM